MIKSMEITTKLGCANACHFCPQHLLSRSYKGKERMMTLTQFEQILQKIPKDVRVDFSGFVEPFFNPSCGRMIRKAKGEGYIVHLYTTLMGMTDDDFETLRSSPPDFIKIHAPDITGLKIAHDIWLPQFNKLLQTGLPFETMSMGALEPEVQSFMEERNLPIELPSMISRGGNLWKPQKIEGPLFCSQNRWHQNVVLPNGDVYGCCMDYGLTLSLGNILIDGYDSIFAKAETMRQNTNPPADSICRTCEWAMAY